MINIDQPHISPTANLPQTIVMAAGPGDVQDVIVDGKVLIKDKVCLHFDEEEIRHEAKEAYKRIAKRAGLTLPSAYFN